MGSSIEAEMKEAENDLQMLSAMGEKVSEAFRNDIESAYKEAETLQGWQIAGGRMDRFHSRIFALTDSGPDPDITHGVTTMLKGLFGSHEERTNELQEGITGVVGGVFNAILGSHSGSEMTQREYLIVPYGFALFRVDICMWKYSVSAKASVKQASKSVLVVSCGRGILDIKDLKPAEVIAFVQEALHTHDPNKIHKRIDEICTMYKQVNALHANIDDPNWKSPNNAYGNGNYNNVEDSAITTRTNRRKGSNTSALSSSQRLPQRKQGQKF